MSNSSAIQTEFDGLVFRSRFEARILAMLKHCQIPFSYETEGFQTGAGWYLPDFHLPTFGMLMGDETGVPR